MCGLRIADLVFIHILQSPCVSLPSDIKAIHINKSYEEAFSTGKRSNNMKCNATMLSPTGDV